MPWRGSSAIRWKTWRRSNNRKGNRSSSSRVCETGIEFKWNATICLSKRCMTSSWTNSSPKSYKQWSSNSKCSSILNTLRKRIKSFWTIWSIEGRSTDSRRILWPRWSMHCPRWCRPRKKSPWFRPLLAKEIRLIKFKTERKESNNYSIKKNHPNHAMLT